AGALTVSAQAGRTVSTDATGVTIGGVAAGFAGSVAIAGGSTIAGVGPSVQIGQSAGQSGGSLTLNATHLGTVNSTGAIVAASAVGGAGDEIYGTADPDVYANIGRGARVTVAGPVSLAATTTPTADIFNKGGGVGGITVAAIFAKATIGGDTWAYVDQGA